MKSFETILFQSMCALVILLTFIFGGNSFVIYWVAFFIFLTLMFLSATLRYIAKQENVQSGSRQENIPANKAFVVAVIILACPVTISIFGKEAMGHSFIFVSIFLTIPLFIFGFYLLSASLYYKISNKYPDKIKKTLWMGLISVGIAMALFVEYLLQ